MKRRILSMLLSVVMLFTMLPAFSLTASAADAPINHDISKGVVMIEGCADGCPGHIITGDINGLTSYNIRIMSGEHKITIDNVTCHLYLPSKDKEDPEEEYAAIYVAEGVEKVEFTIVGDVNISGYKAIYAKNAHVTFTGTEGSDFTSSGPIGAIDAKSVTVSSGAFCFFTNVTSGTDMRYAANVTDTFTIKDATIDARSGGTDKEAYGIIAGNLIIENSTVNVGAAEGETTSVGILADSATFKNSSITARSESTQNGEAFRIKNAAVLTDSRFRTDNLEVYGTAKVESNGTVTISDGNSAEVNYTNYQVSADSTTSLTVDKNGNAKLNSTTGSVTLTTGGYEILTTAFEMSYGEETIPANIPIALFSGAELTITWDGSVYTPTTDDIITLFRDEDGKIVSINVNQINEDPPEGDSDTDDQRLANLMLYNKKFDITATASKGGTITPAGVTSVLYNKNVAYTITPDTGYAIADVLVDGRSVGAVGKYTFANVSSSHTIEAVFEPVNPFKDLSETDAYYDAVMYLYKNGIMIGMDAEKGVFGVDAELTRAMLVTILWRMNDCPAANGAMQFKDVPADKYYTEAVRWATSTGLVLGYSDTEFAPNEVLTREQLCTILYRYVKSNGDGFTGTWTLDAKYDDIANVSDWAREAMAWMQENGIYTGNGTSLMPKAYAPRSLVAMMVYEIVCAE